MVGPSNSYRSSPATDKTYSCPPTHAIYALQRDLSIVLFIFPGRIAYCNHLCLCV